MHTHTSYTVFAIYNNGTQHGTIPGTLADGLNKEEADKFIENLGTGEGYKVVAWKNTHTPYNTEKATA